jgi:Lon protease-like protein
MWNKGKLSLHDFDGNVKLFPLPNLVLFPHAAQDLHIFEPRYRQMTTDALAGDRMIAMVLLGANSKKGSGLALPQSPSSALAVGWEQDDAGRPPIRPVACLGRIVADERLEDGRFNLQLKGLCRVRIMEELLSPKLYRSARVRVLPDCNVPDSELAREQRDRFIHLIPSLLPGQEIAVRGFCKLFAHLPLGVACDILSFALPLPLEGKQELLECADVTRRCRLLLGYLKTTGPVEPAESSYDFPPGFSTN